jgi:hypothetical protein
MTNLSIGIISLVHAPVHVTDFSIVNVHVDELSSARIWQHKLCATFSASVNINYRLPIKVYCRICTLRHIRIEKNHGSQNHWECVLSFNMGWRILVNYIPRPWLGIKYYYLPIHIKTQNTFWLRTSMIYFLIVNHDVW